MSRQGSPADASASRVRSIRVERHPLGPRVYLFGVCCHEWHLGTLILIGLGIGALLGFVHDGFTSVLAVVAAVWLIAKDWRDLTRRRRDTGAWRVGLHRPPVSLRRFSRAEPLPLIAAVGVAVVALVNLFSAVTPNIRWRGHLLLNVEPLAALHVFHALAVSATADGTPTLAPIGRRSRCSHPRWSSRRRSLEIGH